MGLKHNQRNRILFPANLFHISIILGTKKSNLFCLHIAIEVSDGENLQQRVIRRK